MRVIATKVGFYGGSRRRVGDVFEVPEGTKGKWFEPVAAAEVSKVKPKAKAKDAGPDTLTDMTRSYEAAATPKGAGNPE